MYKQLTSEQRYALFIMLRKGESKKEMANSLNVHISTIYREIKRNGRSKSYDYETAKRRVYLRGQRLVLPRTFTPQIKRKVEQLIRKEQWSPKQIVGYMKKQGEPIVSHETIYTFIRQDRACGGNLWTFCRHRMKHLKRVARATRIPIPNRIGIEERPIQADGTRFGDWEMDTVIGKDGKGAILTLTERFTNFAIAEKLPKGKDSKELAKVVKRLLTPYIGSILTITTDNGTEFVEHEKIAKWLKTTIYFAHPYSSWEKGSIENYNKLLRQYIHKKTDFKEITNKQIKQIQYKINNRPREKLGFSTPKIEFFKLFL